MTQLKRLRVDKKLLPAIAYQQRMLLNIPVNKECYPPVSHWPPQPLLTAYPEGKLLLLSHFSRVQLCATP